MRPPPRACVCASLPVALRRSLVHERGPWSACPTPPPPLPPPLPRVACKKRQSDHKERRASEQGEARAEREGERGGVGEATICAAVCTCVRRSGPELSIRSSLRAVDADSNEDDGDRPIDRRGKVEDEPSPLHYAGHIFCASGRSRSVTGGGAVSIWLSSPGGHI